MSPGILPFRSNDGSDAYIFVSYAHSDSERVFPIIGRLHQNGYRLWYDEGIDPGTEWPEEIASHLEGCHTFLLFISPRPPSPRTCAGRSTWPSAEKSTSSASI